MSLPVIAVVNQSTVVSDDQIKAALVALQRQVSVDFAAYWHADCSLIFQDKNAALTMGWWQIVVLDDPDQAGALGYHELSSQGTPLGKVFAKLDIQSGMSWTVTLSHELLEMLVDPWINTCAEAENGDIYALEVADAVEADELGYEIGGILVSDFVTPAWFQPQVGSKVDFQDHITKSFQLAPGGYISVLNNGDWTQILSQKQKPGHMPNADSCPACGVQIPLIPMGSRRMRRMLRRYSWRNSTR